MNITKENIDDLNAVIRISVEPEDYRERVDKILRDYRKNASMPGFRPGHVPMGMVKKMYGKAVLADEVNKLVNEHLYKYIDENKIKMLGNPLPNESADPIDLTAETFELTYDLGLAPDFDLKVSDKDKFTQYVISPGDKLIDEQIENLARRNGQIENLDASTEHSMIMGDFNELDESGEIKAGGIYNSSSVFLEFLEDEDAKKELIGLKAGDTVTVDPHRLSRGDTDLAAMLGIDKEQAADAGHSFQFTVKSISQMRPAELNQEFFDKLFGEGEISSEEEMRAKISDDLSRQLEGESTRKLENDIIEKLIEKHKLSLPDEFLKRWMQATSEKEVSMEEIEKDYDSYAKALRWQLIENRIIDQFDLKISYEDLVDYTVGLLKQNMMQYGQTDFDEEMLKQSANNILQNQDEARKINERMYGERVLGVLKDTVSLKDKEVSYDEFVNLATGKPAKKNLLSSLIGS